MIDIFQHSVMLFSVMEPIKSDYIDWLDSQDMSSPVEPSHDGFRVDPEDQDDYQSPTHEDCGYFGYAGLCED